ncbi:hypothetical protein [Yersinia enterocolitica]|uniref:hypothetical protein n=2 Tax=Yersinia enterocolitica TaxID=630 RepID=UPI0028B2D47F|nr:hypothetical protein [Yersinia enterocolitica]ELI8163621.1 hypothetical protein [Yersinia enterocolitica]HEB2009426.1 hypothetical protein [Yersinia enterocolitica]HEG1706425.1 hypothetical protein [Yersinia enterocolitica]
MFGLPIEVYKLILVIIVAIFITIRLGGVSFLFRLFTRAFNLSYYNGKLQKSESVAYDLQLFKALEGANVRSINDANLIRHEMNLGKIQRIGLIFTSIFGYIGDRKRSRFFFAFFIFAIIIFFAFSFYSIYYTTHSYKIGYYRINPIDSNEFVSLEHITDKNENFFMTKTDCKKYQAAGYANTTRARSCYYLLTSEKEEDLWLSRQIEKNDLEYRIFYWGGVFYFLLALYFLIGLFNFHQINKYILKLKEERL